jgi:N-acetylmuramoyl-L-alanine amidase
MKITNHRLQHDDGKPYRFVPSPNIGTLIKPDLLIIHFTEGASAEAAVTWLTSRASYASAHLIIGRDGSIVQLVPFNRMAWHTGPSAWKGRKGLASATIGIELDNAGPMKRDGGVWKSSFKRVYPDDQVIEAVHKFGVQKLGWHTFPDAQLEAARQVASLLKAEYHLTEVLGHDDISPKRKWDPGPAFPMDDFRLQVFGG